MPKPKQPTTWREWQIVSKFGTYCGLAYRTKRDAEENKFTGESVRCVECRVVQPKPKRKGRGK